MPGSLVLSALEACGLVAASRDPRRTAFWLPPCIACCFAGSAFDVGGAAVLIDVGALPADPAKAYRVLDAEHITDRIIDLTRPAGRGWASARAFTATPTPGRVPSSGLSSSPGFSSPRVRKARGPPSGMSRTLPLPLGARQAPRFVDEQPVEGVAGGSAVSRAYVAADGARYAVLCNSQQMIVVDFRRNTATPAPRTPGLSVASDCDAAILAHDSAAPRSS